MVFLQMVFEDKAEVSGTVDYYTVTLNIVKVSAIWEDFSVLFSQGFKHLN